MAEKIEFLLPLQEFTASDGGAFRLSNSGNELQRVNVLQRDDGKLTAHANLHSVTHGTLVSGGESATLIIMDFSFHGSQQEGRRYREATINIRFTESGTVNEDTDPIVFQIAPSGSLTYNPLKVQQSQSTTIQNNIQAGLGASPVSLGIGLGFEKSAVVEKTDAAKLFGSPRIDGRNRGKPNSVRWTLLENRHEEGGIPSQLRTAILLSPRTDQGFRASVSLELAVDIRSRIKYLFGQIMKIDPVFFAAKEKRTNLRPKDLKEDEDLRKAIDAENLSACNLAAIGQLAS